MYVARIAAHDRSRTTTRLRSTGNSCDIANGSSSRARTLRRVTQRVTRAPDGVVVVVVAWSERINVNPVSGGRGEEGLIWRTVFGRVDIDESACISTIAVRTNTIEDRKRRTDVPTTNRLDQGLLVENPFWRKCGSQVPNVMTFSVGSRRYSVLIRIRFLQGDSKHLARRR